MNASKDATTENDDAMRFVRQYEPLAHKIARSFTTCAADADDLFQEICIALWSSRGSIPRDASELTFVYRMVFNRATSWHRKKSTYSRHLTAFFQSAKRSDQFVPLGETDDRMERLYEAIQQLPELDRSLVLLYLDRCNYAQISDVTGLSESAVGKRLQRAKQKLAMKIQTGENE